MQRLLWPGPVVRAVTGDDEIEFGVGEGQRLNIAETRVDVRQPPFPGQQLHLAQHRSGEIQGYDFGHKGREAGRGVPCTATGVQHTFIAAQGRGLHHHRQILALRMHGAR